jgi:hypothetical protein
MVGLKKRGRSHRCAPTNEILFGRVKFYIDFWAKKTYTLLSFRVISSMAEHFIYIENVGGSSPSSPTTTQS